MLETNPGRVNSQRRTVLTAHSIVEMSLDPGHVRLGVLLLCVLALALYWQTQVSGRFGDVFVNETDLNAHVFFLACFGYALLMHALSLFA